MQKVFQLKTITKEGFDRTKLLDLNEKPEELIKKIFEYEKNPYGFFLMSGNNGSGKTYVADALYDARTTFRHPYYDSDQAIFITQAELNQKWIENYKEAPINFTYTYKNTKLLVLDDMGTRNPSDGFLDFLYLIIDFRWKNRETLGTIITTNKNAQQFREIFGDAILSRATSGFLFRLDGKDRRAMNF